VPNVGGTPSWSAAAKLPPYPRREPMLPHSKAADNACHSAGFVRFTQNNNRAPQDGFSKHFKTV